MDIVGVGGHRHALRRQRHQWGGDIAQLQETRQEFTVAGDKPHAQPGQVRALGERLEHHHVGVIGRARFQHAGRRMLGVDFRVALVAEDEETKAAGKANQPREIGVVRHRPLRV